MKELPLKAVCSFLFLALAAAVTPENMRAHSHRQRVRLRLQMESCPQQYLQSYIPADPLAVCDQNNMVRHSYFDLRKFALPNFTA